MRVLVACEYSGAVREAFRSRGHDAWSCDLLPTEVEGPHYRRHVFDVLNEGWDMMLAFPPCTHLAVSGARWFHDKREEQREAIEFFLALAGAPIERIAIENPIGIISTQYRKPDQIIQPWQFGHGETKATCLWLKNLPKLSPTNIVDGREARVHRMPPGPNRWKERSRTFAGIAAAMAEQWGNPRQHGQDAARAPSPALDRLKEEIEKAPHAISCNVHYALIGEPERDCTCFKSRALRIIEEGKAK